MFCTKCKNEVAECECGDIDERLEAVAENRSVKTEWCTRCDSHHSQCDCKRPEYELR